MPHRTTVLHKYRHTNANLHAFNDNPQRYTSKILDGTKKRSQETQEVTTHTRQWQTGAEFEMLYYHITLTICIVCIFSVCMKYPNDLLYLQESAKYNSSILKSVQKLCAEWHTTTQLLLYAVCCVNTVNSM